MRRRLRTTPHAPPGTRIQGQQAFAASKTLRHLRPPDDLAQAVGEELE